MKVEIEFQSMSEDQIGRLLKDAVKQNAINSMPVGKRKKALKEMEDGEACSLCGEEECECDDDNGSKVEMNRRGIKPNLPSATTEDLPRGMNLSKYTKKGKK